VGGAGQLAPAVSAVILLMSPGQDVAFKKVNIQAIYSDTEFPTFLPKPYANTIHILSKTRFSTSRAFKATMWDYTFRIYPFASPHLFLISIYQLYKGVCCGISIPAYKVL
jgi:hypothetical protein